MKDNSKEVLYGIYNDDDVMLDAIHKAHDEHLDIMDVFTPFPVHGLDKAMHLEESRLHIAGFIYGIIGTMVAFGFMSWVFVSDWPIIFGGKPYWSAPAFIPVTFELTVLFASVGMTVTFYTICGMAPGITNPVLDDRITDDKFCIAFETNGKSTEAIDKLKDFLRNSGAEEINMKSI
jgi:hypothetical protein